MLTFPGLNKGQLQARDILEIIVDSSITVAVAWHAWARTALTVSLGRKGNCDGAGSAAWLVESWLRCTNCYTNKQTNISTKHNCYTCNVHCAWLLHGQDTSTAKEVELLVVLGAGPHCNNESGPRESGSQGGRKFKKELPRNVRNIVWGFRCQVARKLKLLYAHRDVFQQSIVCGDVWIPWWPVAMVILIKLRYIYIYICKFGQLTSIESYLLCKCPEFVHLQGSMFMDVC